MMNNFFTILFAILLMAVPAAAFAQPTNDNVCSAILIDLDFPPMPFTNVDATVETDEVVPPEGQCENAWCDGLPPEASVWFFFIAPANGAVVISTCFENTQFDTQLALWQVGDCFDFSSFTFVAANDDHVDGCNAGDEFASTIVFDGLIPGASYYIQFDGFDGAQDTFEIAVNTGTPTSLVNIVHNSADLALNVVDIWINDELLADDMEFRTCTEYLELATEAGIDIDVCDASSSDNSSPLYSFDFVPNPAKNYVAILNGIYSESGYSPMVPLALHLFEAELNGPTFGTWNILYHNGSTDAPTLDIELLAGGNTIVNDISYPEFAGNGYVQMPSGNYSIDLTDADGNTMGIDYCLQLAAFGSPAITIITSGFMDPSQNSNGPAFGLFYVNHFNGTVEPAIEGACPTPANDQPCDAVEIIVDAPPVTYDNSFASADEGEVNPPNLPLNDPEADCIYQWCDGEPVTNTLWFKFVAPSSGSVAISTCFPQSFDSQVAVWLAGNCSDYSTFQFHQCNDDADGGCGDGDLYASAFYVYDLTPGTMYWVQLDGWSGTTGETDIEIFTNVGVTENSAVQFHVYPNPATETLNIQCNEINATATLRDIAGREVKNFAVKGFTVADVQQLSAGVYTLTISSAGGSSTLRVVIE